MITHHSCWTKICMCYKLQTRMKGINCYFCDFSINKVLLIARTNAITLLSAPITFLCSQLQYCWNIIIILGMVLLLAVPTLLVTVRHHQFLPAMSMLSDHWSMYIQLDSFNSHLLPAPTLSMIWVQTHHLLPFHLSMLSYHSWDWYLLRSW